MRSDGSASSWSAATSSRAGSAMVSKLAITGAPFAIRCIAREEPLGHYAHCPMRSAAHLRTPRVSLKAPEKAEREGNMWPESMRARRGVSQQLRAATRGDRSFGGADRLTHCSEGACGLTGQSAREILEHGPTRSRIDHPRSYHLYKDPRWVAPLPLSYPPHLPPRAVLQPARP